MRTEFEKLPFIENLVNRKGVKFGKYYGKDIYLEDGEPFEYLNGAWWMYQENTKTLNGIVDTANKWANAQYTYNSDSTDVKIQQIRNCGNAIIELLSKGD